jgi:cyclic pyranopterin phosphate synthase
VSLDAVPVDIADEFAYFASSMQSTNTPEDLVVANERLQKMRRPLVDGCGRVHDYLRVSVTDRCNLRCTYCMPISDVVYCDRNEILSYEEIVRLVRIMAGMGITKVRLTGGEPTVRKGLENLITNLAKIPGIETVALTTNGVLFAKKAELFRAAGLKVVNISLDSLNRETFERITRRDELGRVMAAIEAAIGMDFAPVKVNVVVIPGVNDHEVEDFAEFVRNRPLRIRFIEHMPFQGNHWTALGFVPFAEIRKRIEQRYELHELPDNYISNRVARDFAIPGFQGTIGFISAMSDSFCVRCSRLRVTADGSLKTCLFYPARVNLREALRYAGDAEIERVIRDAVQRKRAKHPRLSKLSVVGDLSMNQIGG